MKRTSKYNAKPTYVGELRFDSKLEAHRWKQLVLLERAGEIHDLTRQVRIPLHVNQQIIGRYVADFVYMEDGEEVVEDAKGHQTPLSKWKLKHYAAEYGREVRIFRTSKKRFT